MKKILIIFLCFLTVKSFSQEEKEEKKFSPTLKFKGFTQIFFSATDYPEEAPYGFSVRRLRLSPYGNLTKDISYLFSFAYDQFTPNILDAYINFKMSDQFQIKAGLFASPGAKSGAMSDALFSTTKMNLIQRSMVTQNYNTFMGLKGYRDLGVQFHGYLFDKKFYYATMFANPKADNLFTPSVKNPKYSHQYNGIKNWTRLEVYPVKEIGIGAFSGISNYKDSIDHTDNAFGAHFIYRSDNLRVFSEIVYGKQTTNSDYIEDFNYLGYFLEVGYVFNKKFMPVVGIDRYQPNTDGADANQVEAYTNFSIGCNIFINEYVKLMANYIRRNEKMAEGFDDADFTNDLFIICLQFSFKQD